MGSTVPYVVWFGVAVYYGDLEPLTSSIILTKLLIVTEVPDPMLKDPLILNSRATRLARATSSISLQEMQRNAEDIEAKILDLRDIGAARASET